MILRRIGTSFRKQDWSALILELMIVILGVYLGFQATEWGEARGEARLSEAAIDGLVRDFEFADEQTRDLYCFATLSASGVASVAHAIRDGRLEASDSTNFQIGLMAPLGYWYGAPESPTYEELRASGRLGLIESRALRDALRAYQWNVETAQSVVRDASLQRETTYAPLIRHVEWGLAEDAEPPAAFGPIPSLVAQGWDLGAMTNDPQAEIAAWMLLKEETARVSYIANQISLIESVLTELRGVEYTLDDDMLARIQARCDRALRAFESIR